MYTHHTYVNTDTRLCSNLDTFGPSPPQATPSLCSPYSRVSSPAGTPPPGPRSHCPDDASQSHHPGKTSSRRREEGVSAAGVSGVAVLRCGSPTRGECCPKADLHTAPCGNKKKKNVKPPRVGGKVLVAALWGRLSSSGHVLDSPLASHVCMSPTSVSIAESRPPSLYNSESPPIYLTE